MTTSMKALLLSASASLALTACGGGDESDAKKEAKIEVDGAAITMKSDSPLDTPFKLNNAQPLDVDAFLAEMDGEVTYDSADFDSDLGATVITNFRPAVEEDGAETSIGRIELYGVNEEAMAAMDSGEGFDTMTELFRKIRMFDVKTSFPVEDPMETGSGEIVTGNMSIGALEIDTVKVMGGEDMGPDGVEFGGMAMKDMSFAMPFSGEGDGIKFAAPDFRVAGYKDGVFGGIMAADLNFDLKQSDEMIATQLESMGPQAGTFLNVPVLKDMIFPNQQSGSIGMMRWDGFTITNLIPYLKADEKPPVSETDLIKIGGMEFLDQKVSVNGKDAGSVAKTVLDPIEFHHFMPKKIRMVSEGARSDLTAYVGDENPEIATVLENNGLDDVTGESTFEYSFDPRSGAIKVDADGTADGFYGMSFNFAMSDFDYDAIAGDEGAGQAALMNAAINSMTLKIDDEKLLDTVFAVAGAVTEQDPAGLRQQAIGLLSFGAMQGAQFSPRVPEYATALTAFLSDGGTLTIAVEPDAPVTFGGLAAAGGEGNPAVLLDTLNVTVTQK